MGGLGTGVRLKRLFSLHSRSDGCNTVIFTVIVGLPVALG